MTYSPAHYTHPPLHCSNVGINGATWFASLFSRVQDKGGLQFVISHRQIVDDQTDYHQYTFTRMKAGGSLRRPLLRTDATPLPHQRSLNRPYAKTVLLSRPLA